MRSTNNVTMIRGALFRIKRVINGLGSQKQCYICKRTFSNFSKFRGGSANRPEFMKQIEMIGSDTDNFGCIYCNAHDRERHLYMFFDKLNLWERFKDASIVHIAPERNLKTRIKELNPKSYVMGDLYPDTSQGMIKIDVTGMQFEDQSVDFFICNHVLEHVPEIEKAQSEIYRILKPGGMAVLQTPYSKLLKQNFYDVSINTDDQRRYFYGQEDHVRVFGEEQFLADLAETGFTLHVKKHDEHFDEKITRYHGVNKLEDLILVERPA